MNVVALVQCTAADLYASRAAEDYCIDACRRSGLFRQIVLAVPDSPESAPFDRLAANWKVALHKGPVYDVAERLLGAAKAHDADVIVRVLLRQFYLDVELVRDMVGLLVREQADYVTLPLDFNYALAGDVCTRHAIEKAVQLLQGDDMEVAARRFSPWRLMEEDAAHFRVVQHPGCANYTPSRVRAIRQKLGALMSENQVHFDWKFPASAYAFVAQYLRPADRVLDIACARGEGSRRLAETCADVVGVDLDEASISSARNKFSGIQSLSFVCGDAQTYSRPGYYDAIVSMHTLEHLPDPRAFLDNCRRNLKPAGRLFIEVPLLLPRPLGEPLIPSHQKEYLPDELAGLLRAAGFRIDGGFGKSRHAYVTPGRARQAVQYHCSATG